VRRDDVEGAHGGPEEAGMELDAEDIDRRDAHGHRSPGVRRRGDQRVEHARVTKARAELREHPEGFPVGIGDPPHPGNDRWAGVGALEHRDDIHESRTRRLARHRGSGRPRASQALTVVARLGIPSLHIGEPTEELADGLRNAARLPEHALKPRHQRIAETGVDRCHPQLTPRIHDGVGDGGVVRRPFDSSKRLAGNALLMHSGLGSAVGKTVRAGDLPLTPVRLESPERVQPWDGVERGIGNDTEQHTRANLTAKAGRIRERGEPHRVSHGRGAPLPVQSREQLSSG
jgi:hypothetical protein